MATTVNAISQEAAPAANPLKRWLPSQGQRVLAGAGLLVIIAAVAWFVVVGGKRKEIFAARSLEKARAAAESGNLPLASSEFQKLIQAYEGTDAAQDAVISLNQIRLISGQAELAVVGLRDFLNSEPKPQYIAPANGLLGAALENAKRPAEAAKAYQAASSAADVPYLKAEYLLQAARTHLAAGNRDAAITQLRTVVTSYKNTPVYTEAQVRLAELTGGKM
ncbi:MAG: tetratricopeptide repeat protein, partial [Acidobacteria bacterium]|nr:tetratricopeptide repeat protein [Acidobacteriota bacterium]